ncbi:MAG: TIGR03986 family CRISPR-associated RAMP protein [Bacteroidales bacterium]|nr:TIGR03986 family CRISPR-associated RAMP protein [Bacteroidales bacterium]MDY0141572.1 TIGR03986 family CRISPR-associated RAMP protein [Bacteroidales bacterium]
MSIKSPYNFVPVSDDVFYPNWADKISHDVPFKDGISGSIELEVKAESPVFVRNGHVRSDADEGNLKYNSFCNINGKYFIPATSLKGCIRNVLEIISFSKMRVNKNMKFAQREWDNERLYPLKQQQSNLLCGWLKREGNNYVVINCGKPYRIAHTRIDEYINSKGFNNNVFRRNFSKNEGIDLRNNVDVNGKSFDPKTAAYKYEMLKNFNLGNLNFELDDEYCCEYKDNRLKVSNSGEFKGTIVLTGQPDKWIFPRPKKLTKGAGKFYEFVFIEPNKEEKYEISERDFNHFKFIYSESAEWDRVNKLLNSNQNIPVFFRVIKNDNAYNIKDFGLAFLYKLPFDKAPYETLPENHRNNCFDMSDCLFGGIHDNQSLKGRVQFNHAMTNNAEIDNKLYFTLGSPKASYYPNYIEQNGKNGKTEEYLTYNDSKIRGWKRYPLKNSIWGNKEDFNKKLDTIMIPVKKDTVFKSKIRFFNLNTVEYGALLSALTFHTNDNCFHQIGQGKPNGLGQISIKLTKINTDKEIPIKKALGIFEYVMSETLGFKWSKNKSIIELVTLSSVPVSADDVLFHYMKMSTTRDENEFLTAKQHNEFLQTFTELSNKKTHPTSFYDILNEEDMHSIQDYLPQNIRLSNQFNSLISQAQIYYQNNENKSALLLIEQAEALDLDNVSHHKLKQDVLKAIEIQTKLEEIEAFKQQEAEKRKAEAEAKLSSGLEAYLEEKNLKDEFKVKGFKMLKAKVEKYLKDSAQTKLPESEWESLEQSIKRVYDGLQSGDKKVWQEFENNKIWIEIATWTTVDFAKNIYNNLF